MYLFYVVGSWVTIYVFLVYMCVHHTCDFCHWKLEVGIRTLGTRVWNDSGPTCRSGHTHALPLQRSTLNCRASTTAHITKILKTTFTQG